jgi:hypothetical protein
MKEIKQGSKEIAGEEIDLSDLDQAYEKGYEQQSLTSQGQQQEAAPAQPASGAPPQPAALGGPPVA